MKLQKSPPAVGGGRLLAVGIGGAGGQVSLGGVVGDTALLALGMLMPVGKALAPS